jgi:hypothetical protein
MKADHPKTGEVTETDQSESEPEMEGMPNGHCLPVPIALREQEISEKDFEALLRIAADKNAPAGRLKRTPRKVPVRASQSAGQPGPITPEHRPEPPSKKR